jgi:hypothetical protein
VRALCRARALTPAATAVVAHVLTAPVVVASASSGALVRVCTGVTQFGEAAARVCVDGAACSVGLENLVGGRHNCHHCRQPLHGSCGVALSMLERDADVDLRVCVSCATIDVPVSGALTESATQPATPSINVAEMTGARAYVCAACLKSRAQTAVCIHC